MKIQSPGKYVRIRSDAYLERANTFIQANRYSDAEKVALDGVYDIKRVTILQLSRSIREENRKRQQVLIRFWLGIVNHQCINIVDYSRLIGSVAKAVQEFAWLDMNYAEKSVDMLEKYVSTVEKRASLSVSTLRMIEKDLQRFQIVHTAAQHIAPHHNLIVSMAQAMERTRKIYEKHAEK